MVLIWKMKCENCKYAVVISIRNTRTLLIYYRLKDNGSNMSLVCVGFLIVLIGYTLTYMRMVFGLGGVFKTTPFSTW